MTTLNRGVCMKRIMISFFAIVLDLPVQLQTNRSLGLGFMIYDLGFGFKI